MKTVILAGGFGTRLVEETEVKPKPMVEIGGYPIIWHIMKIYSSFGVKDFFIALGYKGDFIKRFFVDYHNLNGSMTVDMVSGRIKSFGQCCEPWSVNLIDTGLSTYTGGRVRRMREWLENGTFMVTYGDGVADLNVDDLLKFHRSHGRVATVTAVRPPARFGGLVFNGDEVVTFTEKPQIGEGWINGGFLVFESKVFDYLSDDESSLEANALEALAADGQLMAYRHHGFWQCMDTMRDVNLLRTLWEKGSAPWKLWN